MKRTLVRCATILLLGCCARAETPKGSITIDAIADIKYPTEQTWSPDGKAIAYLWDAAGKQDLYVGRPGEKPVAFTDFSVNPGTLCSGITHFEWASADTILFGKEGQLWKVSTTTLKPVRMP